MTPRGKYVHRTELNETFDLVAKHLGASPHESLSAAALRVFRQNCASQPTLDVARIVLEMNNQPGPEQWQSLQRCARIIRGLANQLN